MECIDLGAIQVKVAIFAGGKGSRLIEETTIRPKASGRDRPRPLLWHIMQHYSVYGHHHFVLALGYMGSAIKKYIAELSQYEGNLRVDFTKREIYGQENSDGDFDVPNPPWMVDLIDTGVETMTGGRLQMLEHYLGRHLHADLWRRSVERGHRQAVAFHKAHGRAATMTVVNPHTTFGHLQFDEEGRVLDFIEKPDTAKNLINGGFFVLEPRVFDIISDVTDATVMWEQAPLRKLMEMGELMAYQHPASGRAAITWPTSGGSRRCGPPANGPGRPGPTGKCRQADRALGRPGKLKFKSDDPGIGRGSHPVNGCATGRSEAPRTGPTAPFGVYFEGPGRPRPVRRASASIRRPSGIFTSS
jgi:glucose-1-phosphate cytidylyltransferase